MYSRLFVLFIIAQLYSFSFCTITRVAVFCSADDKASLELKNLAYALGEQLGLNKFGLITGGSNTGLMKEVVDGYAKQDWSTQDVYGVLPRALEKYHVEHPSIPVANLYWVDTFNERLEKFHELADIIVVLPGGFGTLHELMDFLVHNQFGLDNKQIILVNKEKFWDDLLAQFKHMNEQKLLSDAHLHSVVIVESAEDCVKLLRNKAVSVDQQTLSDHYWKN